MTRRSFNILLAGLLLVSTAGGVLAQALPGLGSLPLYFVAQPPQDGIPQFLAGSRDSQVLISPGAVQFYRRAGAPMTAQVVGFNDRAQIQGEAELTGKFNYFQGADPAKWRASVPTFTRVRVTDIYPGISLVYHGNQDRLEYDFEVAPGASPAVITLRFTGTNNLAINDQGDLNVGLGAGAIRQPKPDIYQTVAGIRHEIAGGFRLVDERTVAFTVGAYDRSLPLVIDPILNYSTYFGGTAADSAQAVAVNTNDGSVFIAGYTLSQVSPNGKAFSTNGYRTNFLGGSVFGDAFVAKFDSNFNLDYFTYLGGNSDDCALALAVDHAGHAYVAGFTESANFPVVGSQPSYAGVPGLTNHISGPYLANFGYLPDGFVTELQPDGGSLVFSTYLGGNGEDAILGLTLDSADNVYVTGYTASTNLPVANPISFQLAGTNTHYLNYLACPQNYGVNFNGFVAKIASQGTNLDFCSYLGGNNIDIGTGIAVDGASNLYVAGYTSSTNFPNTNGFGSAWLNGYTNQSLYLPSSAPYDAFVVKLAPLNAAYNILYSTYLGGSNTDQAYGIAVDGSGAYVTGLTASSNFCYTATNVIHNGATNNSTGYAFTTNVFLTKLVTTNLNPFLANTPAVAYSLVFGGLLNDNGRGVAVDSQGNAFVTGSASSPTFPASNGFGLLRTNLIAYSDVFVTAFGPLGTNVLYSVLLGGNNNDFGYAIAVDQNSSVYVAGQTLSVNFPVTAAITNTSTTFTNTLIHSAWSPALSGPSDGFLAAIGLNSPAASLPLTITRDKTNYVSLTWPENYQFEPQISHFVLESATNLLRPLITVTNGSGTNTIVTQEPGTNWFPVTTPVILTSNLHLVVLPIFTNKNFFYRLNNTNYGN
jgi:hypothetical protein